MSSEFDGFISYSRRDRERAEQLRVALQRIRRPFYRRRSLAIALDTETMGSTGSLREQVRSHIDASDSLIVVLSSAAAESDWVNEEVEYWLSTRTVEDVILAWVEGEAVTADIGEVPPMPPALLAAYNDVPVWIDLRHFDRFDLTDLSFRSAVAQLAAPLHRMAPEDVASEDLALYRRGRRLRRLAIGGLAILTVAATVGAILALQFAQEAQDQSDRANDLAKQAQAEEITARSRAYAATSLTQLEIDTDVGALLAIEAYNTEPTVEALDALLTAGRQLASGPERLVRLPPEADSPFRLNTTAVSQTAEVVAASWGSRNSLDRSTPDSRIFIWDARSGETDAFVLETDRDRRWADLWLSASGSVVIASNRDGFEVWDLDRRARLAAGEHGPVTVNRTLTHILLPEDGQVSLVAIEGWQTLGATAGPVGFAGAFFTEDQSAVGLVDGDTLQLHDLAEADGPVSIDLEGGRVVDTGNDGLILIQIEAGFVLTDRSGARIMVDVGFVPQATALATDGSRIALVDPEGDLVVLDTQSGAEVARTAATDLPTLDGRTDGLVTLSVQEIWVGGSDGASVPTAIASYSVRSPDTFDVNNRFRRFMFFELFSGLELFRTEADGWWVPPGTGVVRLTRGSTFSFVDPQGAAVGPELSDTWPAMGQTHYGYSELDGAGVITLRTASAGPVFQDLRLQFADAVDHTSTTVDPTLTFAAVGGSSGVFVHSLENVAADGRVQRPPDAIADLGDALGTAGTGATGGIVEFLPWAQRWVATGGDRLLVGGLEEESVQSIQLPADVTSFNVSQDNRHGVVQLADTDPVLVDLESMIVTSLPATFTPSLLSNDGDVGVSFSFAEGPVIHHRSGSTIAINAEHWQDLEPPTTDSASEPGLALSPDGTVLALSDGAGLIRLFDTATGERVDELTGTPGTASAGTGDLEFSPDGTRLAILGQGRVTVWEVESRTNLGSWIPRSSRSILTFDPTGRYLLIDDQLWDIERNRRVGPAYLGGGARFSSDGQWLSLSSGTDVVRWPVGVESITEVVCGFARRPLTDDEAARFNVEETTACR